MQPNIAAEMNRIVDDYIEITEFNHLLKSFIAVKAVDESKWSELTQVVHYMFDGSSANIDRLAALTELIILAFDILDDLQDGDTELLWMTSPNGQAMHAVVTLLIAAIGEAARLDGGKREGLLTFAEEASQILMKASSGQYKDLANSVATEADYLLMIQEKSGSLIRLACYMGYGSSAITASDREVMNELAYCIGAIAQIENDIQDILRFDLKNDLLHKKKTLPTLFLLAEPDEEFPFIQQYYEDKLSMEEILEKKQVCIQYIQDSGCIEYSKVIQRLLIQQAELLLSSVNAKSPWKEKFAELAHLS